MYKLKSPLPKNGLCKILSKLAQWFWRRRFLNFVNKILLFSKYFTLEKGVAFHWKNFNPHHPRMLCAKFGWNWPGCSEEEDFEILSIYFHYFVIYPWKRAWPFICINLNSHQPRILCAKFIWKWPSSSEGEGF